MQKTFLPPFAPASQPRPSFRCILKSTPSSSHDKRAEDRGRFSPSKDQGRRVSNEISLYNRHGSTINSVNETRNSGSRIIFPDLFTTAMSFLELDVDIQLPLDSSFGHYSS